MNLSSSRSEPPKEAKTKSTGATAVAEEEYDAHPGTGPAAPLSVTNDQLKAEIDAHMERIENMVIARLHKIDTGGVFNNDFASVLQESNAVRGITSIPYKGRTIYPKEGTREFQEILTRKFSAIPWALRGNLYDPEIRDLCLTLIQELSKMSNELSTTYKVFFDRVNQLFYHSKKLLAVTITPQIIEQFGISSPENVSYRTVVTQTDDPKQPDIPISTNTQVCTFEACGEVYACIFRKKTAGAHFGAYIDIGKIEGPASDEVPVIDEDTKRRYYLKAFHKYPATEDKDSGGTHADTTKLVSSIADYSSSKKSSKLELQEPFVYRVLEQLEFGPKVHFMINPYIIKGFYIVTEDLNTSGFTFIELDRASKKYAIWEILGNPKDPRTAKTTIDTTEASILLNTILGLSDIKGDNVGYIGTPSDFKSFASENLKLMIIDFLTPAAYDYSETPNPSDVIMNFWRGHLFSGTFLDESLEIYDENLSLARANFNDVNNALVRIQIILQPPQSNDALSRLRWYLSSLPKKIKAFLRVAPVSI